MDSGHNAQTDSFVDPALAAAFATAKADIPPAHRVAPLQDEVVASREVGYMRLQDWAFCNGYALAIESSKPSFKGGPISRIVVHCVHHKEATRNSRKIVEVERRRVSRKTQANGCKFSMYISQRKRMGGLWAIGYTQPEHNHDPPPDPFQYDVHRSRRPGHAAALDIAATHRGTITYGKSKEILQKQGLHVDRKTFYNLKRRGREGWSGMTNGISAEKYLAAPPETPTMKQSDEGDCSLQLREWDAVEAIKRRLIAAGKYSTERRVELVGFVWAWVKADTIKKMIECREKLLSELHEEERSYLVEEYQPKEHQLIRAYTKQPAKLKVQSPHQIEAAKERKRRYRQRIKDEEINEGKRDAETGRLEPLLNPHEYVFGHRNVADSALLYDQAIISNEPSRKRICSGLTRSSKIADFTGPAESNEAARTIRFAESAGSGPMDYSISTKSVQSEQIAAHAEGAMCAESTGSAMSSSSVERAGRADYIKSAGSARSANTAEPVKSADSTDSADLTQYAEGAVSAHPTKPTTSADPIPFPKSAVSPHPTKPTTSADPTHSETAESAHPTKPTTSADSTHSRDPRPFAESAEFAHTANPATSTDSTHSTDPTKLAESAVPPGMTELAQSPRFADCAEHVASTSPAESISPVDSAMPPGSTASLDFTDSAPGNDSSESTRPTRITAYITNTVSGMVRNALAAVSTRKRVRPWDF